MLQRDCGASAGRATSAAQFIFGKWAHGDEPRLVQFVQSVTGYDDQKLSWLKDMADKAIQANARVWSVAAEQIAGCNTQESVDQPQLGKT